MDKQVLSYLALARNAGKVVSGEESCEKALRNETAMLIITAEDASENTKKKFRQKTFHYKVPYCVAFDKTSLGNALGKEERATVAVCDKSFAKLIIDFLQSDNNATPTEVFLWQK